MQQLAYKAKREQPRSEKVQRLVEQIVAIDRKLKDLDYMMGLPISAGLAAGFQKEQQRKMETSGKPRLLNEKEKANKELLETLLEAPGKKKTRRTGF
jgi:hypothetical protein